MQGQAVGTAAPANPGYAIRTPQQRTQALLFVFFAGDTLGALSKARNPAWKAGGAMRSGYLTLEHCQGFLRKCEITPMLQNMVGELQGFVHPERREGKASSYELEGPDGSVRTIDGKDPGADENSVLLFTPFYPTYEAGRLTGQGDGVVLMPVSTFDERDAAQNFLFPGYDKPVVDELSQTEILLKDHHTFQNWLPKRIEALKAHFYKRKAEASSPFEDRVVDAAIRSCDDIVTWSTVKIADENARFESAKTKGWAWPYGDQALAAFEMTGQSRLDQIAQDQGAKLDKMVDAVGTLAELQANQMQAKAPTGLSDPERAELEALRAFRVEQEAAAQAAAIAAGGQQVIGANKIGETEFEDGRKVVIDEVQCTAKTSKTGEQCKNKAEAGTELCKTHTQAS